MDKGCLLMAANAAAPRVFVTTLLNHANMGQLYECPKGLF
jgi:hypothetical protein